MDALHLVLNLYFAASLGVSGLTKLAWPAHFAATLQRHQLLPPRGVRAIGRGLPWAEVTLAGALIAGAAPVLTAALVAALFVGFLGGKALLLRRNPGVDCGCYGPAQAQAVEGTSVATATILAGLALVQFELAVRGARASRGWRAGGGIPLALVGGFLAWRTWRRERWRRRFTAQAAPAAPPAGPAEPRSPVIG